MTTLSKLALATLTVGVASVGAFALHEIGAVSVGSAAKSDSMVTVRGAKAPVPHERIASAAAASGENRIESSSVVTHVEVIGGSQDAKIVLLDPNGDVVFETDPTRNSTVIARDVIVPSVTVRSGEGETVELRVVSAAPPVKAPMALADALENGERLGADIFYRGDL